MTRYTGTCSIMAMGLLLYGLDPMIIEIYVYDDMQQYPGHMYYTTGPSGRHQLYQQSLV
jgi:hypothetical protein